MHFFLIAPRQSLVWRQKWRNNPWIKVTEHLVDVKDGLKNTATAACSTVQSLNMLLSNIFAIVDLHKQIHLIYFYSSTCWMICIVLCCASWLKMFAFWTVFLRILLYESAISPAFQLLWKWRIFFVLVVKLWTMYSCALVVQVKTMHKWFIVLLLTNVTVCTYPKWWLIVDVLLHFSFV